MKELYHNGKSQTISEWAEELGIPKETIRTRLFYGKSTADALATRESLKKKSMAKRQAYQKIWNANNPVEAGTKKLYRERRNNKYLRERECQKELRKNRKKNNPTPEQRDTWNSNNQERREALGRIAKLLERGKIEKPENCPECQSKTASRKMYVNLDDDNEFISWICSWCHGERLIKKRILREGKS